MENAFDSVEAYLEGLPEPRRNAMEELRRVVRHHLPEGFSEKFSEGMIQYVVPLSRYPKGYHAKKGEPLPFLALASQKNHIALYHMGLYGNVELHQWFVEAYSEQVSSKLDMGKSCVRFKNLEKIPFDLIGKLCSKINVEEYIKAVESAVRRE